VSTFSLCDGRTMGVRSWPGTAADTIVLLHGLLDCSEGWSGLCGRIGGRRVAFDLAGFGNSEAPARGSIADYARDVVEGLDQLGIDRFTLIGHSLGGAVATAIAEQMPERVQALVLLAPAGFGRIRLAEAISIPVVRDVAQMTLPVALSSRLMVTAGYMAMVSNHCTPEHSTVQRVLDRGGRLIAGAREGTRAVVVASRGREAFHRRRVAYDGPVFAVWGDRDRIVPSSHSQAVTTAFPSAQVAIWPGMGHHPQHERREQLVELVGQALAARRRPARSAPTAVRAARDCRSSSLTSMAMA